MRIQRIYDAPDGGIRVLVDRLWPRGVAKEAAMLDDWAKPLTPSSGLRQSYHNGMLWEEFKIAYMLELEQISAEEWQRLEGDDVVLLTAAKNEPNHAHVLLEFWNSKQ